MNDIERIYSLLTHSNGLKIRAISQELELDKYYVAEIMFSSQNIPYWYQDDDSLWYAKEGALQIEEYRNKVDELIAPVEKPQRFNLNRFLEEDLSESLRSYLRQISKYRVYTNDEMIELFKRYRNGELKAFDMIIKSQQRLVANIALFYCRKGAPLEDIIQEGNVGLVKAAERFDYTQYRSFSNYAKKWILQSISISMTTLPYLVRLPLNQLARYRKVRMFKEMFEQQHGYPPSVTDIDVGEDVEPEKITLLYQLPDNLRKLVEFQEDMDLFQSSTDIVTHDENHEYNSYLVRSLLQCLKNREERILRSYYGIDMVEDTLSSIGDKMYLTRERVRQILWSSVRKLQDVSHVKREEAKIGEMIRIVSSNQVGRVVNTKQGKDGTTILVVKMGSGYTTELSVYDTPYHIVKNEYKKKTQSTQKEQRKNTQKNTFKDIAHSRQKETKTVVEDARREVSEIDELKVGDKIYYNKLSCIVIKIIENGKFSKLIIEYANGVRDVVPYNKSRYVKIQHTRKETHNKPLTKTRHINSKIKREAMVGDRIMYGSRPCLVLEKKTMRNSLRLIVKYDDGSLDNVQNDWDKYRVL